MWTLIWFKSNRFTTVSLRELMSHTVTGHWLNCLFLTRAGLEPAYHLQPVLYQYHKLRSQKLAIKTLPHLGAVDRSTVQY